MKMIKHSSLFKWPQNGASKMINSDIIGLNNGNNNSKSSKQQIQQQASSTSTQQKLWLHPPTTLQNGHIAYLVKYFGNVEVNQPKGIEVIKESINKLKFIQPIKKSEGNKIPKVELTISVNGVAIQEPKTKKIYCQFPLHRISYCADDKTEKKFFSFIAKDVDTDKHLCFVFMSEKMSEEIILTIGQAFDLAYAKFIETSGRELEIRKQLIILQKKVCHLEEENKNLKERLNKYEPLDEDSDKKSSLLSSSATNATTSSLLPLSSISSPSSQENGFDMTNGTNGHSNNKISSPKSSTLNSIPVPPLQPPPSSKSRSNQQINLIDVDIECDDNTATLMNNNENNLIMNNNVKLINDLFDENFDPRADDSQQQQKPNSANLAHSPVDSNFGASITQEKDIFGCEPFQVQQDSFGMPQFNVSDLDSAIVNIDKKLAEMRDGFSQGLSADGFNLDS